MIPRGILSFVVVFFLNINIGGSFVPVVQHAKTAV
jgi:hypothetical protein